MLAAMSRIIVGLALLLGSTPGLCIEGLDQALVPLVEQARRTYPEVRARFLAGLPHGQSLAVLALLRDSNGKTEQVVMGVNYIDGSTIVGTIWSEIRVVSDHAILDTWCFPDTDVLDWSILSPDGTEEGNLIGKWQAARKALAKATLPSPAGMYTITICNGGCSAAPPQFRGTLVLLDDDLAEDDIAWSAYPHKLVEGRPNGCFRLWDERNASEVVELIHWELTAEGRVQASLFRSPDAGYYVDIAARGEVKGVARRWQSSYLSYSEDDPDEVAGYRMGAVAPTTCTEGIRKRSAPAVRGMPR
jgi:hypothetical protein